MIKNPVIDQMRLDGGSLCLDFVNTVPDRKDNSNRDNVKSFNDLIHWARKAAIIDGHTFNGLEKLGAYDERKAKFFFSEAIGIRTLLYAIFQPIATTARKTGRPEGAQYTDRAVLSFSRDRYEQGKIAEQWNFETAHVYAVTAPVLKSARELLLSGKLDRVKECQNCGWLFLDAAKNGRRRWCSMEDCGNTVKALEYYYRKKGKK